MERKGGKEVRNKKIIKHKHTEVVNGIVEQIIRFKKRGVKQRVPNVLERNIIVIACFRKQ
jgi:hypothetical protein